MDSTDAPFLTTRGVKLHSRTWEPTGAAQPKAVFFFFHGLTDYLFGSEDDCMLPSFHARAKRLTAWGGVCTGVEFEGHGRSDGLHGYFESYTKLVDDVEQYLDEVILVKWPGAPVFILAESMGGMELPFYCDFVKGSRA